MCIKYRVCTITYMRLEAILSTAMVMDWTGADAFADRGRASHFVGGEWVSGFLGVWLACNASTIHTIVPGVSLAIKFTGKRSVPRPDSCRATGRLTS